MHQGFATIELQPYGDQAVVTSLESASCGLHAQVSACDLYCQLAGSDKMTM